jgi:hypothetical protein
MHECVTLQASGNGHDVKKNNNEKARNNSLQYPSDAIIKRGTTEEEEYEKFFTLLESPIKSPSSSCHANAMKDLTKHFVNNFNLWSLNENKINNKLMERKNQS